MPIPVSSKEFLRLAEESGIVSRSVLDAALRKIAPDGDLADDAQTLANSLVSHQTLTTWQAEKLLEGRHQGLVLGNYRLKSLLGRGSMGAVYLAEHALMGREVALKVMSFDHEDEPSYLNRFLREARAVAALDHPNIVRAFDVGNEQHGDRDIYYLAMQYIPGVDLAELVKREGRLDLRRAVDFTRQVSDGLVHAHQEGLIHRDIKPGNLLVAESDTIRILDLGLAVFLSHDQPGEASLTREGGDRMLGTADYMSPEQAMDSHEVDHRADIYSLGCTLYFMITGYPPFRTGTVAQRLLAHQTQAPTSLKVHRPEVPDDLCEIVNRMLAKDPDDRFQSCHEVTNLLSLWLKNHDRGDSGRSAKPSVATLSLADTHPGEIDWQNELDEAARAAQATEPPVASTPKVLPPQSPERRPDTRRFKTIGAVAVILLTAGFVIWGITFLLSGPRETRNLSEKAGNRTLTPLESATTAEIADSQNRAIPNDSVDTVPQTTSGRQPMGLPASVQDDPALMLYLPFDAPGEQQRLSSRVPAGASRPPIIVTISGEPEWVPGRTTERTAIRLGGPETNDYLELNEKDSQAFNLKSSFSVMVWFRVAAFSGRYQTLISKGDFGFRIARYRETSGLAFAINKYQSSEQLSALPQFVEVSAESYPIDDGEWHQVVGVVDAESQNVIVNLFIDGEIRGSSESSATLAANPEPVMIGANSFFLEEREKQTTNGVVTEPARQFEGDIDEVAIFQRVLTADEIRELYEVGQSR